ncbi:MAG: hypothetical protein HY675_10510 [Chloroflexi bacterium]|nr:hypothetical protein [Chloroflexota bacterium]
MRGSVCSEPEALIGDDFASGMFQGQVKIAIDSAIKTGAKLQALRL